MITTRLTERLGIRHPVVSAPMANAAGGHLASAVSAAGGLGLIGGAYGDADWVEQEIKVAGTSRIGVGFISWALEMDILQATLAHDPALVMLSFGDPKRFARCIHEAGVPLMCQVQTLEQTRMALDAGAAFIVAQGAEAGGHGLYRATMTLVPEVADLLQRIAPDTVLLAAGGIADGRGLAAALMLGADGALVGSRLWASEEALVHPAMLQAAIQAGGDDTIRSSVADVARRLDWPAGYTARVLRNAFTERWHNDLPGLIAAIDAEASLWTAAWKAGDTAIANTFVGEATGLIRDVRPAADLIEHMTAQAEHLLGGGWRR